MDFAGVGDAPHLPPELQRLPDASKRDVRVASIRFYLPTLQLNSAKNHVDADEVRSTKGIPGVIGVKRVSPPLRDAERSKRG